MTKKTTKKLLETYKKASITTIKEINQEIKYVAAPLNVADQMDIITSKNAFITLNDYKEIFRKCTTQIVQPRCATLKKALKRSANVQFAHSMHKHPALPTIHRYLPVMI